MIHGHIHNTKKEIHEILEKLPRVLNACVEVNGYRPVTLDELIENNRAYYEDPGKGCLKEWPEGERIPQNFRIRLGRILGATVDFILVGVDIRNRAAVASRRAAMLQRQAKYYATGRIKPGIRVACRVIAVGGNRVTLEAVGVDCEVNANALSWEWFPDVTDLFSTEDLVVAKVMDVSKDESTGRYSVKLSVKAATENPDLPTLRKLVPGSSRC